MTYTIAGVFRPDLGSAADGLTVQGYQVSSWSGSPPALGTTPPGSPPVSATTDTSFGNHGAWELALPTNEDYFIVVEYSSDYFWQRWNVPAWLDSSVELDVLDAGNGLVNADSVSIAGTQAFGLSPDPFGYDVQPVGTTNNGSVSNGDICLGAFVDHVHAGLGESLGLPGTAGTRYAGATSAGAPSSGSYLPGDFVIDQTGVLWIYTSSDTWVDATGSGAGSTGDVKAFAGITPPGGWLTCDGSAYSRTSYAALCAALSTSQFTGAEAFTGNTTSSSNAVTDIPTAVTDVLQPGWPISGTPIPSGTTIAAVSSGAITLSAPATATTSNTAFFAAPWGVGDGTTTFNVPDLRGRTLIGAGSGPSLTARVLAASGGDETHTLDSSEVPDHCHSASDAGHNHTVPIGIEGGGGFSQNVPQQTIWLETALSSGTGYSDITVDPTSGGGGSHNNMQPFAVAIYVIKT